MAGPFTETYSIGLPPTTQAEVNGLIADLRTTVQKLNSVGDAILAAIPAIKSDAQEAADAMKSAQSSLDAALGDIRNNAAEITSIVRTFKIHEHV